MSLPLSSASKIASYAISPPSPSPSHLSIETSQAAHRIALINAWDPAIRPGAQILELGCGQGTCTAVLAEAIRPDPDDTTSGENIQGGHIDAVDPGEPDYGAPFTLAQAQGHLSTGPLGELITFHRADPVSFLSSSPDHFENKKWDVAVLAHCIWYFSSATTLSQILSVLRGRVSRLCIAEWSLRASEPSAAAHVLATLARATFEAHRTGSHENIQTPLSPVAIKDIAARVGWKVLTEGVVVPDKKLADGFWETGTVVDDKFPEEVDREVADERVRAVLRSARDATVAAAEAAGGYKKVRSMDVWVATFVLE